MGGWQLHTCILFHGLVCSHSGSARSTSHQPDEVLSIAASMVVLRLWSIPRRTDIAALVLCGNICVDSFASLGEQLLPCCIHCCHCTVLFTQNIANQTATPLKPYRQVKKHLLVQRAAYYSPICEDTMPCITRGLVVYCWGDELN